MITARLTGDDRLLQWLRDLPEAVRAGLGRALLRLAAELERTVQQKLGGEVLRVRSGALRSSIKAAVDSSGAVLTATVGSDLRYAAAQEYGFAGTVDVRAQLRRITEAFGRPIAEKTIRVGGFSRRMNLPERSFLRSALSEMQPQIAAAVREAVSQAVDA